MLHKSPGNAEEIRKWFQKRQFAGLILPDGWYGRPFDNLHRFTSLIEDDEHLQLTLDDDIILQFAGLKEVRVDGSDLVLGPFAQLQFSTPRAHETQISIRER